MIGVAIAVSVAAGLAGWWLIKAAPSADPDNAAQVAAGRAIYAANCASCHGAKLEGQPNWMVRKPDGRLPAPPHDESGHTWHHDDDQLFNIVKNGLAAYAGPTYRTDMPAFKDVLSDADVWAVLAFIKNAWPPEIRDRQREITRQRAQAKT